MAGGWQVAGWFCAVFVSRGSRDGGAGWGGRQDRSLYVPAEQVWELQEHLPTGRRLPVSGRTDLNEHRPLGDAVYDDVLTGLKYDDRLLTTALSRPSFQVSLTDQKAGREIVIATDTLFR